MAMSVSAFSAKDIQPPTQSPPPPPRPSLRDVLLKAPVQTQAYTHPRRSPEAALSASTVPAIYPTTSAGGWTVVHHGTLGPPGALEPFLVPAARRSQSQSSARLPIRSTGPWRPPAPSSSVAAGKDPRPLPVPPPLDTVSVGSTTFVRRFRAQSSDREQGKRRVSIGETVPSVVLAAGGLSPASAMASALSPISPSASASASAPTSTSAPASALSPASASLSRPLPLPPVAPVAGPSFASAGPSSASAGPSSAHTHAGPSSSPYAPSSPYAAPSHAAAVAGPGPSSSANANAAASSSSSTLHQKAKSPAPHGQGHGYAPTSPSPSAKKSKSKPRARTPDAGLRVTNPNPERSQYSYTPPSTAAGTARSPTLPFDTVSSVWAPRPAADSHPRSAGAAERTRTTSGGGTIGALGDRPPLNRKASGGAIDFAKRPPLSNVGESLKRKTSGGLTASASLGTIGAGGGGTTRSPSLRRQMSGGILVPSGPRKSSLSANTSPFASPLPSPGIPPPRTAASSPAHSRSPSASIPIFTPGASANAYAVPPAAALIPGPPPPLVTVRTRGHWRSASVSDAADSFPMSPPVRKGSDSAVVAGSEAPKPATGVIPIATRPFVPPPPPPPLVTVRDLRATRTSSGDSISNRASPAPSPGSNMTASPGLNTTTATASVSVSPAVSRSNLSARSSMPTPTSVLPVPPPPPPPPLTMPGVLLARKDGGGPTTSSPSSYVNNASGGNSALPSAGGFASETSTPSSARSTPSAYTWRSADMEESPMTAVTTPASREGTWDKKEYAGSPLATSALPLSPQAQASKRERRRRLQLHSPIDVSQLSPTESGPQTPPIHSHPIGDESEEGGLAWPDSSTSGNGSMGEGWLAALEGEVREMEMDDTILSPPVFAAPDPADLEPDELDMYDNSFDDDVGYGFDVAVRPRSRSPSPIRYARRASVDTDIIFSDSSDDDDSDLDRPITTDAASADSPAASAFNDTRSTFSRARSTRSRQRRRNTRVAAPPVPLGSAAGMNRRGRARSADSSIVGFGDALAPSEMWRIEQAARGAVAAAAGHPVEMRYVYQASAAQLPASVPPPAPVLMPGRGSGAADSLSSLPSTTSASYYDSGSVSGHGHGSSESGGRFYGPSPSTSKSSLPLPPPPRKEGMKLIRRDKKDREKAKAKEREKTMRNSMPHRNSFSLLRGSHAKTANSSAEALMVRGNAHGLERASSSSAGSEEHGGRSQHLSNSNKPTLFRANPSLGR